MSPFDYLNSINYTKKDLMVDDLAEKSYNAYIINRSLSYFSDTVLLANEMNRYHQLDNKLQFDFLTNTIRKRKRFSKWDKLISDDEFETVKSYYKYSNEKARQVLSLLNQNQIDELKKRMYKGGQSK
jgi:hypothetical protein